MLPYRAGLVAQRQVTIEWGSGSGAFVGTSKLPAQAELDSSEALLRTGHDWWVRGSAALHRNSCWIPLLGTCVYAWYGGILLAGEAGPPGDQAPTVQQIDTSFPHAARVWNYWLGGKDNYPVDREIGNQILESFPPMADIARAQRTFLVRVVTHLAREEGIRQFLDLGTGLPTQNNTHEIAQSVAPECRIVYVDNDPLVLAHARALLVGAPEGATAYIDADVRETEAVLEAAGATLDMTQPIGVTMLGILGHMEDEEAYRVARSYVDALPTGSYLGVADTTNTSDEVEQAEQMWNDSDSLPYFTRSPEGIARFFDGLELVEPGVVPALEWRPDPEAIGTVPEVDEYCGLARKS